MDEELIKVEFEKLVASITSDINVGINCEFREKLKGLVKVHGEPDEKKLDFC